MLLGTLGATLLRNILAGKGAIATSQGRGVNGVGEGIVRAGYGNKKNKMDLLMPPDRLTNFEIQKCYQNEPRFNGVYSRDNGYGAYVINLDGYSDIGAHSVALYVSNSDITYFDSFGVEYIPKDIKKFINDKNIKKW